MFQPYFWQNAPATDIVTGTVVQQHVRWANKVLCHGEMSSYLQTQYMFCLMPRIRHVLETDCKTVPGMHACLDAFLIVSHNGR